MVVSSGLEDGAPVVETGGSEQRLGIAELARRDSPFSMASLGKEESV